jgi:hypothetical protein
VVAGIRAADPEAIAHLADGLSADASTLEFCYPDAADAFSDRAL